MLEVLRGRRRMERLLQQILVNQEDIMAAIDNLEANSGALTGKVDQVLVKIDELKAGSGNPNEAREQAVADNVQAQIDRLSVAIL